MEREQGGAGGLSKGERKRGGGEEELGASGVAEWGLSFDKQRHE